MKIVLSTNNPGKTMQIMNMFVGSGISILSLAVVGIVGEAVEDGSTLQENALKKALFAWKEGRWAMADDTGIFVDALDGAPGVNTANWVGEDKETNQRTLWILQQLKDVHDRRATFKTVAAIISPVGKQYFFEGEVQGRILEAPRAKSQPKLPWSSIFQPDGSEKVWAEMTVQEENAISHRGKAFQQARAFLETFL
ncbi:MAG: non-canonical purine NTP pyrophosphatase [bacterium]|nr:non-canonical purine NTP pyrophosphatase [bacterium]